MADLIETNNIAGLKVYGQQQVEYTVEGESGRDFGAAVACASMRRAFAVETATSALSDVVRRREQKLDELGEALAYISAAAASFKDKDDLGDTTASEGLAIAYDVLVKYGLIDPKADDKPINIIPETPVTTRKGVVSKRNVSKVQTNTQYALDKEDNRLQQDLVSLQSYFSKRDQALSQAASLVKKVNNTITSGIRAIN